MLEQVSKHCAFLIKVIFMEKFNLDAIPWALAGSAGMLGRLMFHAKQVQRGQRKPVSWMLLWDIPIALGMGWAALGLGIWLHVAWEVVVSISLISSYLGPHVIDRLFVKWAESKFGKDGDE